MVRAEFKLFQMTSAQLLKTTLKNVESANIPLEQFVDDLLFYRDILKSEERGGEIGNEDVMRKAFEA